jgi:beta-phosphoglucomutase-like phosphatase (HAD superfamily)
MDNPTYPELPTPALLLDLDGTLIDSVTRLDELGLRLAI